MTIKTIKSQFKVVKVTIPKGTKKQDPYSAFYRQIEKKLKLNSPSDKHRVNVSAVKAPEAIQDALRKSLIAWARKHEGMSKLTAEKCALWTCLDIGPSFANSDRYGHPKLNKLEVAVDVADFYRVRHEYT